MGFFPSLYRAVVDALAGLPIRMLVTVGDAADPAEIGPLPANVRVERWVPQAEVFTGPYMLKNNPKTGVFAGVGYQTGKSATLVRNPNWSASTYGSQYHPPAYLDKINAEGGINGRKVNMISYDDAYEPTKTMAMTRKLVEEDNVLLALGTIGTNTNAAIQPYLNSKKVPHLLSTKISPVL